MVSINNDLYIFGGYNGTNYLNDFYKINTLNCNVTYSKTFTSIPERHSHTMVAINNDIYIFGGYDGVYYLNDFYKISTINCNVTYSKTFTDIPKRSQHSMTAINNDIYIFGGYDRTKTPTDTRTLPDFYKIDTLTCNVVYTNINIGVSRRYYHNMVSISSNIYIFGGYDEPYVGYLNDFYRIDTTNYNVTTIYSNNATNIIPRKTNFGMTAINNDIYIFGGAFDFATNDFYKITKA
jgi:N-acetylneuraminic acid mutarotase